MTILETITLILFILNYIISAFKIIKDCNADNFYTFAGWLCALVCFLLYINSQ